VFAAVFWVIASVGFSIYLRNFGTYNEVYGSIGAVIVMLMWLFISAYLVLLGGALNAELTRAGRGTNPK
jgi:membrane protein